MGQIVTVNFRGDEMVACERDGEVFVALKPIAQAIGLDWSGQLQRLKRDPVLSEGMGVMPIPLGSQDAVCLRLALLNGWLFTIDASRVPDPAVREKVTVYRRECFDALHRHFSGVAPAVSADEPSHELPLADKRKLVTEARHTFDVLAARELWFRLGLPITPAMIQPGQPALFTYTAEQQRPAA